MQDPIQPMGSRDATPPTEMLTGRVLVGLRSPCWGTLIGSIPIIFALIPMSPPHYFHPALDIVCLLANHNVGFPLGVSRK